MFLRVYDKNSKKYFKSICYAKIDVGAFEKAVVINPRNNCAELVNMFDEVKPDYHRPLYEIINSYSTEKWHLANVDTLAKLNKYLKANKLYKRAITHIAGYPDLCNNVELLIKLFEHRSVPLDETKVTVRPNEDISEWNYVRTQEDADKFMELFAGFHDATIKKMTYEESQSLRKLNIIFDNTSWFGVAELCFEGLITLHLTPTPEHCTNDFEAALLKVEDELILWAGDIEELDDGETIENFDYEYDYIKALNLKWRKID